MVYGQEVVVPLQFREQALEIAQVLQLDTIKATKDILFQLQKLEEDRLVSIHHKEI